MAAILAAHDWSKYSWCEHCEKEYLIEDDL